ncbi:DUF1007 family protein [uncultured Fibrobacter sp.]|uniref:DUF1007 family protein n=1 Tax=uncultured Fibrobacter sp. TaxID=261512 RepID=UPI0025E6C35A|nr:DUF1007 family protein [uncultured Fibrobacter sp.]
MRRTLKSAMLLTAGLTAMAVAHPHVFVDATIVAVFDGNGLVGIKNHWVYDEMYSAATFASADSDGNGQLSAKETEQLKNGILGPIASSNYYNYVLVGTEFLPAKGVKNFKAEMKNGKLALDFTVSFSIPVKQDYTMATVAVNDPTNYIQMTTDMEEADVEAPDELDVDFFADNLKGLTLFRAFRSEIQGLYMRFKK